MQIIKLKINNFRGIKSADILLPKHGVLIGDNNIGKTTILEALDLVLGPDRLNQYPPIDEHDFFQGQYRKSTIFSTDSMVENNNNSALGENSQKISKNIESDVIATPRIEIEVIVIDLNEQQVATFGDYIEFWDLKSQTLYSQENLIKVDSDHITTALRISFHGWYDEEEDDFRGKTYFTRSLTENENPISDSRDF